MIGALRLPLLQGLAAAAATAALVVWLARTILADLRPDELTLNVLLRGSDPFRGVPLEAALATALGRSLALVAVALAMAGTLGIALGALYALSSSRALRGIAWSVGTVGVSLPSFFWATFLLLVVVLVFQRTQTRVLPTSGFGLDEHLVLPALALGLRPAAYVFRTTATALDEVRHGDFVRSARAKGLLESAIERGHILPNAMPSIATGLGLAARAAVSSLAIVEYVFSWNGAGFGFIHAVANGKTDFAVAIAVSFALALALTNVAVGAAARAFDPRIPR